MISLLKHSNAGIHVFGTGEVEIKPNQALITIGAITEGKDLTIIQKENASVIDKIMHQFISLGLEKKHIQTVDYHIDPVYEYLEKVQVLRGYKVTHLLQLTIKDLNKIGLLIDTAVRSGANSVANIQFTVEDDQNIYNQTLQKAIVDAQFKALSLANQMGVRINPIPYLIVEEQTSHVYPLGRIMSYSSGESTPIQAGLKKVSAKIRAEFSYC